MRYAARMGSTDWLLSAWRMPSCATRRSSSLVAGRASRAVARNRSRPASQARAMAERWGGTPVESSQRTRLTTARAMCRAMPERRRSSSAMRVDGSVGATFGARTALDLMATFAMGPTIRAPRRLGLQVEASVLPVLFDECQDAPPCVVAGILPLGEGGVEEAVGRSVVDVHLVRHVRRGQLLVERVERFERRRSVGARDQKQQRRLHLRHEGFAPWRTAIEANRTVDVPLQRRLIPR